MDRPSASNVSVGERQSPLGCFVWFAWLVGGNAILLVLAIRIARGEHWLLTWKDVAFAAVLLLMVLLRFVDTRWLAGRNLSGERTTGRQYWTWVGALIGSWLVLWAVAHSLAV